MFSSLCRSDPDLCGSILVLHSRESTLLSTSPPYTQPYDLKAKSRKKENKVNYANNSTSSDFFLVNDTFCGPEICKYYNWGEWVIILVLLFCTAVLHSRYIKVAVSVSEIYSTEQLLFHFCASSGEYFEKQTKSFQK